MIGSPRHDGSPPRHRRATAAEDPPPASHLGSAAAPSVVVGPGGSHAAPWGAAGLPPQLGQPPRPGLHQHDIPWGATGGGSGEVQAAASGWHPALSSSSVAHVASLVCFFEGRQQQPLLPEHLLGAVTAPSAPLAEEGVQLGGLVPYNPADGASQAAVGAEAQALDAPSAAAPAQRAVGAAAGARQRGAPAGAQERLAQRAPTVGSDGSVIHRSGSLGEISLGGAAAGGSLDAGAASATHLVGPPHTPALSSSSVAAMPGRRRRTAEAAAERQAALADAAAAADSLAVALRQSSDCDWVSASVCSHSMAGLPGVLRDAAAAAVPVPVRSARTAAAPPQPSPAPPQPRSHPAAPASAAAPSTTTATTAARVRDQARRREAPAPPPRRPQRSQSPRPPKRGGWPVVLSQAVLGMVVGLAAGGAVDLAQARLKRSPTPPDVRAAAERRPGTRALLGLEGGVCGYSWVSDGEEGGTAEAERLSGGGDGMFEEVDVQLADVAARGERLLRRRKQRRQQVLPPVGPAQSTFDGTLL